MRNLIMVVLMLSFTGTVYAERCRVKNSWGSYVYVDCERGGTYNADPVLQMLEQASETAGAPLPSDRRRTRQMQREAAELEQYKAETERMKVQMERQKLGLERSREQSVSDCEVNCGNSGWAPGYCERTCAGNSKAY